MSTLSHLFAQLERATAGLLVISESEAPLIPFVWPPDLPFNPAALLVARNEPADTPVENVAFAGFWSRLTRNSDPNDPIAQAATRRFRALGNLLTKHLLELRVHRIGVIDIATYVVGETNAGRIVGLATRQIET